MVPSEVFAALADPTRLEVLTRLAKGGPATATELSASMPITRQAVAKHLAALGAAGLVERHPAGREVRYNFDPGPLGDLVKWVEDVGDTWDRRLERLGRTLQERPCGGRTREPYPRRRVPSPSRSAVTSARWAAATSWAATPTLLNTVTSSPISGLVPASISLRLVLGARPA